MFQQPKDIFRVVPQYQPLMRMVGLDAAAVFKHPKIVVWRKLADRENCTLDADFNGKKIRLHIKRYFPARGFTLPADDEVQGHQALLIEHIPTVMIVGWGKLLDRSSFVITENLDGYEASDKLIERGENFERLLEPTADLAAKLHNAGLHHRDLYLCHFFAKIAGDVVDLKLIDTARVRRLGGIFTRNRWITKDLAQFWYSTLSLPITDEQRTRWLARYAEQRGVDADSLRSSIQRKVASIARHDVKLNKAQPKRNVSIAH